MPNELDHSADDGHPSTYEIRIRGRLDTRWEEWFDGLAITPDGGDTLISGPVVDQAALHGLLRRIRDLGMPLISVARIESGRRVPRTSGDRNRVPAPTPRRAR